MEREAERGTVGVADVFERCPECGTIVVQLGSHRCPTDEAGVHPNRERREVLAERDTRDDEELVGLFQRAHGDAYAYHELEDGQPLCGCGGNAKATTVTVIPRIEAKARGKSPCGSCRRIESHRLAGSSEEGRATDD